MFLQTDNKLYHLLRALRPRQWTKNLSLFAAALFKGVLFDPGVLVDLVRAFTIFCLLSSAMYLINDIHDAQKDALHPVKKNRPIASGRLPVSWAWSAALLFLTLSLPAAFVVINPYFFSLALLYVVIQLAYSWWLRNVIIVDALTVGVGFIIRVFAGGLAVSVSISSWLILATIGLALLLAFGKRRSERTILEAQQVPLKTRTTLLHYPDTLLDAMISMAASFAIIAYSLFTFQTSPQVASPFLPQLFPHTLARPKWMMLTIPMVIYGVARYLYVIYEKKEAESPERVLFNDRPLLFTTLIWSATVLIVVYFFGGVI